MTLDRETPSDSKDDVGGPELKKQRDLLRTRNYDGMRDLLKYIVDDNDDDVEEIQESKSNSQGIEPG